jgi:hypothetical protein
MARRSNAINAQGSRLYIEKLPNTGTPLDITAVTKAAQAVVTSDGQPKVGDLVVFGAIAGMPEIEGQAAVVTVSTATSFTVDLDTTGYAAAGTTGEATVVEWATGCEVKTINVAGGSATEIDITTLCSEKKEFMGGLADTGTLDIDYNWVPSDPFMQQLMQAEAGQTPTRQFKIETTEDKAGKKYAIYFSAFVRSSSFSGGVDSAWTGNASLKISGPLTIVEMAAPAGP